MFGSVPRALSILLPWPLRRRFLQAAFGYKLHPSSRIGFSWTFPSESLVMDEHARIGHLNVLRGLERVRLERGASMGNLNWVTGEPRDGPEPWLYAEQPDRRPELVMGERSSISTRHWLDCTDAVTLGPFAVVGGLRSVLMTHTIDLHGWNVRCGPITLGEHTLVSTNCVLLAGSSLPDNSVLGAMSLLRDSPEQSFRLYAGVPAAEVSELDSSSKIFTRDYPRAR
jgi:hypothetical protein